MKRRIVLVALIATVILLGLPQLAGAASNPVTDDHHIVITIEGGPVDFSVIGPPVLSAEGRCFVPFRFMSKYLAYNGYNPGYSDEEALSKVWLNDQWTEIEMRLNSSTAVVNGDEVVIDRTAAGKPVPDSGPYTDGERVYVPLRFICEAFGEGVEYEKSGGSHRINIAIAAEHRSTVSIGDHVPIGAAQRAKEVMDSIVADETVALDLATMAGKDGGRYLVPLDYGNGYNRAFNFEGSFKWSYPQGDCLPPESENSLVVESPDGAASIRCWPGSDLTQCRLADETFWLVAGERDADAVFDGTIFSYLRFWYDEAEIKGLRGDLVIPDQGQGYQEIAQAWVDAYEGAMLRATPGSKYACTFVNNTVSINEESLAAWYPAQALATDHFYFNYKTIFVRENEETTWLLVGNTAEYKGDDAPEGALVYSRMGPIYRSEEGWRCDGVGTGP